MADANMGRTVALIPAAGKSSRMGRPKLALPLGTSTVLERVLAALRQAGISDILVVIGPGDKELADLAQASAGQVLILDQETPDMQATVLKGLDWLENHFHPGLEDDWLLLPADHPTLEPAVIVELRQARATSPDQAIFIPTYAGKRGHPALISWSLVPALRSWTGQGLNQFLREHASQTCECPVASPDILLDLDTPEDYQRLQGRM